VAIPACFIVPAAGNRFSEPETRPLEHAAIEHTNIGNQELKHVAAKIDVGATHTASRVEEKRYDPTES
jgi:hypothetical protein